MTNLLPADLEPVTPPQFDPDRTQTQEQEPIVDPDAPHPVPAAMENVLYKAKEKIYDLIPTIFLDLVLTVELSHRELKANAKLEATLKKKKTLDLAKLLEADQASQGVVAPENMKELVNSLVDQRIELQGRQKTKALLNTAIKEARKKSLGEAKAAKTSPGKQGPGGTQKGGSKRVTFGPTKPTSKRAKKTNTRQPESDYKQLARQRQNPNPYQNRSNQPSSYNPRPSFHSGRGRFPGRGQGRGRSRGGFSYGRGRGRGRF